MFEAPSEVQWQEMRARRAARRKDSGSVVVTAERGLLPQMHLGSETL